MLLTNADLIAKYYPAKWVSLETSEIPLDLPLLSLENALISK